MKESQKNFAVVGNPIFHSISPVLFANFAKNLKKDYCYSRILCENLIDAVDMIEAFEIQGINITAPFKRDILKYIDIHSEEVEKLGVANTVVWKDQKTGFNTDIEGVSVPLKDYLQDNIKVLVIGAGGAAVAAVFAMKKNNIKDIFIANRTISKAKSIAEKFDIHVLDMKSIDKYHFDIIINTIPVDFSSANKLNLDSETVVFDANYKIKSLARLANANNSIYIDGLQWLVEQGKKSYHLMTGYEYNNIEVDKSCLERIKSKSKIIALIGSMASGKSKIGVGLSEKLGYKFVDIDLLIEEREKMSISEIFENKGEEYFRIVESDILKELLTFDNLVISTGGGIVTKDDNIEMLRNNSWNILFYTSPETAAKRINTDKRPLLKGKDIKNTLSEIFNQRKMKYFRTSDVIINRNDDSIDKNASIEKTIKLIYEDYSKTFRI